MADLPLTARYDVKISKRQFVGWCFCWDLQNLLINFLQFKRRSSQLSVKNLTLLRFFLQVTDC